MLGPLIGKDTLNSLLQNDSRRLDKFLDLNERILNLAVELGSRLAIIAANKKVDCLSLWNLAILEEEVKALEMIFPMLNEFLIPRMNLILPSCNALPTQTSEPLFDTIKAWTVTWDSKKSTAWRKRKSPSTSENQAPAKATAHVDLTSTPATGNNNPPGGTTTKDNDVLSWTNSMDG